MHYSTFVFDLDGTLTDPAQGIVRCMNYALTTFDYMARPEHEIKALIGPPLESAIAELSGEDDEFKINQLVAAYRERYGEFGFAENIVYPGIYDVLDQLKERQIPMGVCTSKLEKYAIKILKEFKLFDYFDFVSGVSSSSFNSPKSLQLELLLAQGQIDSQALMIGDRSVDICAANENTLNSWGVLWGYGDREELETAGASRILETPLELLEG
ncbi:MAG: phosphoglycolate phosphatase [Pseudohongiellaceae bacterium]|jgi:phosphoglycolate phosphatase